MQLEDVVVSGVTEFVRIYIILEYFKIFLNVHSLRRNIISCVITYIITLLSYLVFHNVLVNLIVTVAGIIFLSGSFRGKFQKKLLLSIMLYAIMFVIDLLASFYYMKHRILIIMILSVHLFLYCFLYSCNRN